MQIYRIAHLQIIYTWPRNEKETIMNEKNTEWDKLYIKYSSISSRSLNIV